MSFPALWERSACQQRWEDYWFTSPTTRSVMWGKPSRRRNSFRLRKFSSYTFAAPYAPTDQVNASATHRAFSHREPARKRSPVSFADALLHRRAAEDAVVADRFE